MTSLKFPRPLPGCGPVSEWKHITGFVVLWSARLITEEGGSDPPGILSLLFTTVSAEQSQLDNKEMSTMLL